MPDGNSSARFITALSNSIGVGLDDGYSRRLTHVESALHAELAYATKRLRRASEAFERVFSDLPSGLPLPDVSLMIKQAGEEKRRALRQLAAAVRRFNAFVLDGAIPEDFAEGSPGLACRSRRCAT
jgi:hypothetical protein